jgi:predicted secreted protein
MVKLCANPTTGFQWGENAEISNTSVIAQQSYEYEAPTSSSDEGMIVGAAGMDVWVFDSAASGTATIAMSYGQPWDGGQKGGWTLTINVTVQ